MAGDARREAALVFHGSRRLAAADRRRAVGRVERPCEWRTPEVLHDDHHRTKRLCRRSPRPNAGAVERRPVWALNQRRGWNERTQAGPGRLPTALASVETGQ